MIENNNDGLTNNFYDLSEVKNFDGLARHLKLTPFEFNIGKSLFANVGKRHEATDKKREAKKCLHYSIERMIDNFGTEDTIEALKSALENQLGEIK